MKTMESFCQFFTQQLFLDINLMLMRISLTVKYERRPTYSRFDT